MKFLRIAVAGFLLAAIGPAQRKPEPSLAPSDLEQKELRDALAEAGNSAIDFARVLEQHLAKYPDTPQRPDLELALVKSALESKDDRRVLIWGEKVLARNMDDPRILERVSRILLTSDDKESAERALKYSRRFEEIMRMLDKREQPPAANRALRSEEIDKALGRALVFEARANGNLGKIAEALVLAGKSFETYPTAESAREIGKWLVKSGKESEAILHYADAFALADKDRIKDRAKLAELYRKAKHSEAGLGDIVLEAFDRTDALMAARNDAQRQQDPNASLTNAMDYTITGLDGAKLQLSSLRGKVVIMDFWATWCGPCRAQHPLYEIVKQKYAVNKDVVFLAIATDEDHGLVAPFLTAQKWNGNNVYFEDGLSNFLKVSSIPATLIMDKQGRVYSRMNGFLPDRFVAMLTGRIKEALEVR
jgi:thiol-disulfide isomerase/thioredoxin